MSNRTLVLVMGLVMGVTFLAMGVYTIASVLKSDSLLMRSLLPVGYTLVISGAFLTIFSVIYILLYRNGKK